MSQQPPTIRATGTYRVRLGHFVVEVQAVDEAAAVAAARHRLGRDLPRLYDVINSLETARFQVDGAG